MSLRSGNKSLRSGGRAVESLRNPLVLIIALLSVASNAVL